jgi:hypothetical protein
LGIFVTEAPNHRPILTRPVTTGNRLMASWCQTRRARVDPPATPDGAFPRGPIAAAARSVPALVLGSRR